MYDHIVFVSRCLPLYNWNKLIKQDWWRLFKRGIGNGADQTGQGIHQAEIQSQKLLALPFYWEALVSFSVERPGFLTDIHV